MDTDVEELDEQVTQPLTPCTAASPSQHDQDSTLWGLLIWVDKPELEAVKLLKSKEIYSFGRFQDNDIQVNLNHFNNKEFLANISRHHFKIRRFVDQTGEFVYIDDHSINGTQVNGVTIGKGKTRLINHGDDISIKKNTLFTYVSFSHKHLDYPAEITKNYLIIKTIGKGAYGEVALAFSKTNGKCAIKSVRNRQLTVNKNARSKHDAYHQIKHEAAVLCRLQHPCIVKVEDIVCAPESTYLILEFMEGGTLTERLPNKKQMLESKVKFYFLQLALAVQYCHKEGLAHRDLKPDNILLSSRSDDAILKVSDFGLCKLTDAGTVMKTYCGTPRFVAPEVIVAGHKPSVYTGACDIWSMGVILFLMLAGYYPFKESPNQKSLERQIIKGEVSYKPSKWDSVSGYGHDLVVKMLKTNPERRLTISEVMEHSWLKDPAVICKVKTLVFAQENASFFPIGLLQPTGQGSLAPRKRRRCAI